jgi:4-hydroxythreonine-4-phosphate dehydrogenase
MQRYHPITLGKVYNLTRVTTHVPLSEVPRLCCARRYSASSTDRQRHEAVGYERPRIGVAGLNPHCGRRPDGPRGNRSNLPAIEDARAQGIEALGPFPGDTVFLNMKAGSLT